jgi:hypothetical protein
MRPAESLCSSSKNPSCISGSQAHGVERDLKRWPRKFKWMVNDEATWPGSASESWKKKLYTNKLSYTNVHLLVMSGNEKSWKSLKNNWKWHITQFYVFLHLLPKIWFLTPDVYIRNIRSWDHIDSKELNGWKYYYRFVFITLYNTTC